MTDFTINSQAEARTERSLWGLLAEFATADDVLAAAERVRDSGFTRWDCHTPFVVHGLDGAMGLRRTRLPLAVLAAGLGGAAIGLGLQWWTNSVDYPFLISGKPIFSLPANIPVMFEVTILFAAITALLSMLALNRLPMLYHPLFSSRRFRRATADRFFVSIEAADPEFDPERTRELLESLHPLSLEEVEE